MIASIVGALLQWPVVLVAALAYAYWYNQKHRGIPPGPTGIYGNGKKSCLFINNSVFKDFRWSDMDRFSDPILQRSSWTWKRSMERYSACTWDHNWQLCWTIMTPLNQLLSTNMKSSMADRVLLSSHIYRPGMTEKYTVRFRRDLNHTRWWKTLSTGIGVQEGERWRQARRFILQSFRDLGMGKYVSCWQTFLPY